MSIEILPEQVVTQIAAGEVIERPASVVRELIENSIDSGANNIHVTISHGGRQLIRISDDGSGILENEVELAFTRHATSKLRNIEDLASIQTLGFRGEALASIAAVSRLSVTTRHKAGVAGIQMKLEGGKLTYKKAVGAPTGTVISVENLFYNMPARLKFLKSESTEKRQIAGIVTRYAMAYPHIHFILEQDGREFFRSNGSGQLADVIVNSLGIDYFKKMVEVSSQQHDPYHDSPLIQVFGYVSEPNLHRADRSYITLFVNGRWVQDSKLTYAVIQAYHTLLMNGRYPVAILMINIPPEDLDVNVHPTKAEVRFRNPNVVFETLQRMVRRAVIEFARIPLLQNGQYKNSHKIWDEASNYSEQLNLDLSLQSPGQHARGGVTYDWPNEQKGYRDNENNNITFLNRPRTLPMLRVVGQIGTAYIVAEGPAGLYLIDQHAAHERILYEQFMLDYVKQEQIAQFTLSAQTIQVSPEESRLIEEYLDVLQIVGFKLEQFGPNTFIIRSLPAILAEDSPLEVVKAITDDLERGHTPGQGTVEEKLIKRVCKRAAVKAGQILSHKEMEAIIRQLERCQSPLTCPHGRPTMIHMSEQQLAREFGRK